MRTMRNPMEILYCLLEQHEPGQSIPGPHEGGWKRAQGDGARK